MASKCTSLSKIAYIKKCKTTCLNGGVSIKLFVPCRFPARLFRKFHSSSFHSFIVSFILCIHDSSVLFLCVNRNPMLMKCLSFQVCNNNGHCHCPTGFACPDCRYLGPGGSLDSGQGCVTVKNPKKCGIVFFIYKICHWALTVFTSIILFVLPWLTFLGFSPNYSLQNGNHSRKY